MLGIAVAMMVASTAAMKLAAMQAARISFRRGSGMAGASVAVALDMPARGAPYARSATTRSSVMLDSGCRSVRASTMFRPASTSCTHSSAVHNWRKMSSRSNSTRFFGLSNGMSKIDGRRDGQLGAQRLADALGRVEVLHDAAMGDRLEAAVRRDRVRARTCRRPGTRRRNPGRPRPHWPGPVARSAGRDRCRAPGSRAWPNRARAGPGRSPVPARRCHAAPAASACRRRRHCGRPSGRRSPASIARRRAAGTLRPTGRRRRPTPCSQARAFRPCEIPFRASGAMAASGG